MHPESFGGRFNPVESLGIPSGDVFERLPISNPYYGLTVDPGKEDPYRSDASLYLNEVRRRPHTDLSKIHKEAQEAPMLSISLNELTLYTSRVSKNRTDIYEKYVKTLEQENKFTQTASVDIPTLHTNLLKIVAPTNFSTVVAKQNPLLAAVLRGIPASQNVFSQNTIVNAVRTNRRDVSTKPEDLPEMALPVLDFLEEVQPHIVIGCDRGGRLFGVAMHAAWRTTRANAPFPTLDGKIHFARISKSEDEAVLQAKIDAIVAASMHTAAQRGTVPQESEQLRIMFVDDWVVGGGTKRLAERLVKKHGAQTYFVVMSGGGADATGELDQNTFVSWHDNPEAIGVNYVSTVAYGAEGGVDTTLQVVPVRTKCALGNRQRIFTAAQALPVK